MKHTFKVISALIFFFFMAQLTGLIIINHYIDHKKTFETKKTEWKPLPYNLERPEVKNQSISSIYISIAILIGTVLILLLVRFNKPFIWKLWFFATVWLTLSIAFAAFVNNDIGTVKFINNEFISFVVSVPFLVFLSFIDNFVAMLIAFIISILKLYKPNIIIQNLSEIFIYGGLAAIFVPIINLFAAIMLLIVVSIYDFVAVFKTKHMIKLAKFQSKSKVFAGLLIPYEKAKVSFKDIKTKSEIKMINQNKPAVAVLGGGDIGFTLIFAGVVMKDLMLQETVFIGFLKTLIIPFLVSLALLVLLLKGQQNKFYPAMPVLSVGCFIGYLVVLLI